MLTYLAYRPHVKLRLIRFLWFGLIAFVTRMVAIILVDNRVMPNQSPEPTRRWRCSSAYRNSRRESAVAQLFR